MHGTSITLMGVRVIGLGTMCGPWEQRDAASREHSFSVSEFALTDDGRRVTLHEERGWSGRLSTDDDIWSYTTEDEVKETTFTVVRFADDGPDNHPWEWLVELSALKASMSPSRSCRPCRTRWSSVTA